MRTIGRPLRAATMLISSGVTTRSTSSFSSPRRIRTPLAFGES
jgi:hypothetical protein